MHQYQAFIKYSKNGQPLRQVVEVPSYLPTAEAALVEFMSRALCDHLNSSIQKAIEQEDFVSAQHAANLLKAMKSPLVISVLFKEIFEVSDVTMRRNDPHHTEQDVFEDYLTLRILDEDQGVISKQKKRAP